QSLAQPLAFFRRKLPKLFLELTTLLRRHRLESLVLFLDPCLLFGRQGTEVAQAAADLTTTLWIEGTPTFDAFTRLRTLLRRHGRPTRRAMRKRPPTLVRNLIPTLFQPAEHLLLRWAQILPTDFARGLLCPSRHA